MKPYHPAFFALTHQVGHTIFIGLTLPLASAQGFIMDGATFYAN